MSEEVIRTGVDELLDILKSTSKIPLSDVAKKLNVSIDVVQAWVDFLVEEHIVGIEYKFTTPYIYLNTMPSLKVDAPKDENINLEYFKNEFWQRAIKNNIPQSQIPMLWKNHLLQELELKKKYFMFEAQRRGLVKIEELWSEYEANLLSL